MTKFISNEWDILRELNPVKKPSFDAIREKTKLHNKFLRELGLPPLP